MSSPRSKFEWTDETGVAFEKLKKSIVEPPVLVFPGFNNTSVGGPDVSGIELCAILAQRKYDRKTPIQYASRTLNTAEKKYLAYK